MPLDSHTKAKRILWSQLRLGRFYKVRFLKEARVGPYLVDFYAPVMRLVIDIVPDEVAVVPLSEYDQKRLFYFAQGRITIFSIREQELFGELEAVLGRLKVCVRSLSPGARL